MRLCVLQLNVDLSTLAYVHTVQITLFNVDMLLIYGALFRIKIPYPLQWGAPSFDAGHTFAMMASVFVSLVEVLSLPILCAQQHSISETLRYLFVW